MPRHKKGTLVRAKTREEMGEESWNLNDCDDYITPNGWLYITNRFLHGRHGENKQGDDAYECRSIATGRTIQLFPEEITTKGVKNQDG